ncbi:MAG TPA: carbohydrate binding domain-containing protein [Armatimonadota bacterium]|nr:carbohydrate binding domain-containing protein [Armatimonadota bacterium]
MRIRTFTRFMGFTLICLLTGATGATAQGASKNLIRNPGLEESPANNGLPAGWRFMTGGADTTYTPTITEGGHTGAKSLRIEGKGGWAVVETTQVDIEPGKIYRVRGWVKFEGGAGRAVLKFDYLDANSNFVASAQFHGVTASQPGWQLVTVTATPSNYPKAKRIAASLVLEREGKAWFDDLEMIATDGEQQSNFLVNGNAEDTVGDRPGGWFLTDPQDEAATLASSTDTPKEGERCIALRGKAATLSVSMPGVKLDPAMNYVVSGFLRARKGAAALRLKYMVNSKILGTTVSEPVKEGTWQQRTLPVDRE